MSRMLLTLAVDNAPGGKAIGVKEAIAMDLEKYGDVEVLRVEVQEPEQMSLGGAEQFCPSRPLPPTPGPHAPLQGERVSANPSRSVSCFMACCHTCAHYRPGQGTDERGTLYWGLCVNSRRLVYRLVDRCGEWKAVC